MLDPASAIMDEQAPLSQVLNQVLGVPVLGESTMLSAEAHQGMGSRVARLSTRHLRSPAVLRRGVRT